MGYKNQARVHRGFLNFGGLFVVVGFLLMLCEALSLWQGYLKEDFYMIIAGLILLLGGVATAFAKDKEGKDRLVDDLAKKETCHQ